MAAWPADRDSRSQNAIRTISCRDGEDDQAPRKTAHRREFFRSSDSNWADRCLSTPREGHGPHGADLSIRTGEDCHRSCSELGMEASRDWPGSSRCTFNTVQPEHIRKLYRSYLKEPHGRRSVSFEIANRRDEIVTPARYARLCKD